LWGVGGLRILAAAAGGAATYAGFAPSTAWWATILGLALLGAALRGTRWKSAAGLGVVFGITMFFPLLAWTNTYVGDVPWLGLAGAEALLVAPATALIGPASRRLPLWPVWGAAAWVAGETLRLVIPFGGFPWGGVAFSQPDGPLLPVAAVLGEAGLSFATALAGFGLAEAAFRLAAVVGHRRGATVVPEIDGAQSETPSPGSPSLKRLTILCVWALALVAVPFAGALASRVAMVSTSGAQTAPIAIIQGNVPEPGLEFNARRRQVLDNHAAETTRLAADVAAGKVPQPQFVIWPENASDIDPYTNPDAAQVITTAARTIGVPILVGAVVQGPRPSTLYNMGIVWDPVTGPGQTYIKRHPVPFGEYMPMRGFFRIFTSKVDLLTNQFLPGDRPGNLAIAGVNVGDVICFEVVYDSLVRDVVNGGAQVLVVQTNNATFGWSHETYQQQAMSRVRAVEYGREVLIAATSGVSAVIRPDGSVESSVPLFTAGYLETSAPLLTKRTPGTVLGEPTMWVLTVACPAGLAAVALLSWGIGRRRKASATPPGAPNEATQQEQEKQQS
jgi:apolipoprotein N-acyltransferase